MRTRSGLVVWKRTVGTEEGVEPVAVQIVYWPPFQPDGDDEHWRIELDGDVSNLTAGDASKVAALLQEAAGQAAANPLPAESDGERRRMRQMRGQAPPDVA
jgi:hypothetical protein